MLLCQRTCTRPYMQLHHKRVCVYVCVCAPTTSVHVCTRVYVHPNTRALLIIHAAQCLRECVFSSSLVVLIRFLMHMRMCHHKQPLQQARKDKPSVTA